MNFKQHVMLGVTLIGSAAMLGATAQPVNATAASTYYRGKITKVKAKAYYSTSNAKTYRFTGTSKKLKLKANHALKNYRDTTWTRSKQVYVYQNGKKAHYYYVKAARDGATGWVKTSALKAGRNNQGSTPKKTKAKTYYAAQTGKMYRLGGSSRYLKFSHAKKLVVRGKYIKTKQRTIYKNGKGSTYYYVKRGQAAGWAFSGYLTTKKPLTKKQAAKGNTVKTGTKNGVTNYNVKGDAMTPYKSTQFSTVKVASKYSLPRFTYSYSKDYYALNTHQTKPETFSIMNHGGAASNYRFKTAVYLPIHSPVVRKGVASKGAETDLQSIVFSKNDRYMFVMHLVPGKASNDKQQGWVERYDWSKLMTLGVSKSGQMDAVRTAASNQYLGRATAKDKAILKCIKFGPRFTTGHAQSLALNPKTNELWFVKAYKDSKRATVARLNQNTLKPDTTVNFRLKSTVSMGSVLTFDKNGNAYFWSRTQTPWATCPTGTAKIYKGTISRSRVHFSLVLQGIQMAPGVTPQSIAYNRANNRLYIVSDSSIFSMPVNKLGHLKSSDIGATTFKGKREFESLTFMNNRSAGFLLANRGPAVMAMSTNK